MTPDQRAKWIQAGRLRKKKKAEQEKQKRFDAERASFRRGCQVGERNGSVVIPHIPDDLVKDVTSEVARIIARDIANEYRGAVPSALIYEVAQRIYEIGVGGGLSLTSSGSQDRFLWAVMGKSAHEITFNFSASTRQHSGGVSMDTMFLRKANRNG